MDREKWGEVGGRPRTEESKLERRDMEVPAGVEICVVQTLEMTLGLSEGSSFIFFLSL